MHLFSNIVWTFYPSYSLNFIVWTQCRSLSDRLIKPWSHNWANHDRRDYFTGCITTTRHVVKFVACEWLSSKYLHYHDIIPLLDCPCGYQNTKTWSTYFYVDHLLNTNHWIFYIYWQYAEWLIDNPQYSSRYHHKSFSTDTLDVSTSMDTPFPTVPANS